MVDVCITYGMTGQFSPNKGKHPCLGMFLSENHLTQPVETVYFNDPRHFGTIKFTNNPKDLTDKINELGWDPLQMPLSGNLPWLKSKLKSNKNIGEILLDQSIFCGIGNYVRAEALYKCQLSPFLPANSLNNIEIENLCINIVDIMKESYNQNGTTISTYQNVDGSRGNYYDQLKVYGKKEKDPNGYPVVKEKINNRSIRGALQFAKMSGKTRKISIEEDTENYPNE